MNLEFQECEICSAKMGRSTLCHSCLANRTTIEYLLKNSVLGIYQWYRDTHGKDPYEFSIILEDDARYVKGLADGLNNEELKKIAVNMAEQARFLRCLNQYYYAEHESIFKTKKS